MARKAKHGSQLNLLPLSVAAVEEFERYFDKVTGNTDKQLIRLTPDDLQKVQELKALAVGFQELTGKPFRIALDMGRFIVMRGHMRKGVYIEGPRSEYHKAPSRKGVFRFVRILIAGLGAENVLLIKGLPGDEEDPQGTLAKQVEVQAQMWLVFHRFFDKTGFDRSNLLFARRQDKMKICAEKTEENLIGRGISAIVDDRGEVLDNFPKTMLVVAFSPIKKEWVKYKRAEQIARKVYSLRELRSLIFRYLRERTKDDH